MLHRLVGFVSAMLHIPPQVVKFVVSGGTVALTELAILYMCTDLLHIWYEFSLVLAFIVAFCVSFTLQKFWTFEDPGTETIHIQASSYFAVALINLGVNALALYILVQYAHLWYLFAQVLISAGIATLSFLIYKFVIFKKNDIVGTL